MTAVSTGIKRRVFASVVGQEDNLGDSVLRRAFLDTLRTVGPVSVYIGAKSAGYVSGLGLAPHDDVIRDRAQWRRVVAREVLRGDVLYAYDTGDIAIGRTDAARYARQAMMLGVGRLRGSRSAHLGVGIRSDGAWAKAVGQLLRPAALVAWRDEGSRRIAGVGTVAPDWAFLTGRHADALVEETPREILALCMRSSISGQPRAELDDRWYGTVRALCRAHGLRPVAVAQIGRDDALAAEIARRLDGEAVLWADDDHATHEAAVRAVYARSAVVMGDRLHGLIIAATEGASPVGLTVAAPDKVQRVLESAGYTEVFAPRTLGDPDAAAHAVAVAAAGRQRSVANVAAARARLDRLATTLRERVA